MLLVTPAFAVHSMSYTLHEHIVPVQCLRCFGAMMVNWPGPISATYRYGPEQVELRSARNSPRRPVSPLGSFTKETAPTMLQIPSPPPKNQGRLYVYDTHVAFYSSLLFGTFVTKLVIPLRVGSWAADGKSQHEQQCRGAVPGCSAGVQVA